GIFNPLLYQLSYSANNRKAVPRCEDAHHNDRHGFGQAFVKILLQIRCTACRARLSAYAAATRPGRLHAG
ncbi:hypothetical protein, partial [Bacillus sp. SIMBA_005]|uniref:hypothetical protein n=1 Tax=Bacillus sp. SIMBA_005 TaxID=3085754 RepID=UPI00397D9AF2